MHRFKLTVGDTRPPVYVHLTDPTGPVDLSSDNIDVRMKFLALGSDVVLQQISGIKLPGTMEADGLTADLTRYATPGSGGRVRFDWPLGSLDVEPGEYIGEIEIVSSDTGMLTPHNKLRFILKDDLG